MYDEPYLETCCRAALHRLTLVSDGGRPSGLADQPCLERLAEMDWAILGDDARYRLTRSGSLRHSTEILRRTMTNDTAITFQSG